MVGTWTYTVATNIVTVTGGTSGSPAGFVDAWNADKAGTLELLAATAAALNLSLSTAIKPTDKVALKLNLVITGYSVAGDITLTGKDKDGGAQSEVVAVAGNGSLATTLWYSSIDASGVDCTGTYTIQITQSQWGVVWKQETNQYGFDAKLQIGDASTATYFTDSNKEVTWLGSGSAGGSNWVDIKASATATFGVLIDATTHATDSGIVFLFNFTTNYAYINADTNAIADFYSCSVSGVTCISRIKGNGIRRIWNFIGNRFRIGQITNVNGDWFNLYIGAPTAEYVLYSPLPATMNTFVIRGLPVYIAYLNASSTITGLNASGATTKTFHVEGASNYKHYLINPTLDTWTFTFAAGSNTIVYRQYTFDLKVTDKDNVAISGATVTVKDNTGANVFSVNTAADGTIAQQTVSRGYYNQANGDTLQEYSPHNLTITKAGYITYDQDFTLDELTDWEIALHTQLTGDAVVGDVASGKKFYKDDADTQLTGTLTLTGDAALGDVAAGKTFYNTSLTAQRTGTLALTGDAAVGDVSTGKKFYNNDLYTQRTGTHTCPVTVLTGDANPSDVLLSKTFYKDDATDKLTGTLVIPTRGGGVVHVPSKLEEPLLMLTGVLLTEKLQKPKPSS